MYIEPQEEILNIALLFDLLKVKRKLTVITCDTMISGGAEVDIIKFSTPYVGKSNYVRIRFNNSSKICNVYIQFGQTIFERLHVEQSDLHEIINQHLPIKNFQ